MVDYDYQDPQPPVTRSARLAFYRRRRIGNWLILAILLGFVVLFFIITMIKLKAQG